MRCYYHEDREAVTYCSTCKVGLCKECINGAHYLNENGHLCFKCSYEDAKKNLSSYRVSLIWDWFTIVISGVCIFLVLLSLLMAFIGNRGTNWGIVWFLLSIPQVFRIIGETFRLSPADEIAIKLRNDGCVVLIFSWIGNLIASILLAPIYTIKGFFNKLSRIKETQAQIMYARAMIQEYERKMH